MEAGAERILVRPSLSGLGVVSLIYTVILVAIGFVVDQLAFGGIVAAIRVELAALALCVWAPLQAVFSWYVCTFEVDSEGLHQDHLPSRLNRVLRHLPAGNSIGWQDRVWLLTHTRYVMALCYRVPQGGVLGWLRNLSQLTWIILPWKWLVADIETLQSKLKQCAPVGHPLRQFYGVADDRVLRDEQSF